MIVDLWAIRTLNVGSCAVKLKLNWRYNRITKERTNIRWGQIGPNPIELTNKEVKRIERYFEIFMDETEQDYEDSRFNVDFEALNDAYEISRFTSIK